jgi:hypothetical protein
MYWCGAGAPPARLFLLSESRGSRVVWYDMHIPVRVPSFFFCLYEMDN